MDWQTAREPALGTLPETRVGQAGVYHGEFIQSDSQFMAAV